MRRSYLKQNGRRGSQLVRLNDRDMMRRLIKDNQRQKMMILDQRAMLRAYRDAFEVKDIIAKLFKLIGFGFEKVKDKAALAALKAIRATLGKIPGNLGYVPIGVAKILYDKVKYLAKTKIPTAIASGLLKLAGLLVEKAKKSIPAAE